MNHVSIQGHPVLIQVPRTSESANLVITFIIFSQHQNLGMLVSVMIHTIKFRHLYVAKS